MRNLKVKTVLLIAGFLIMTACDAANVSKADGLPPPTPQVAPVKKSLREIDLTSIKHIAPNGRIQDGGLKDEKFNKLSIADDLIANGKDSIPFLINKLEDETKLDGQVVDLWYENSVGDMSLIILNDLFLNEDGANSTIHGFGWNEFFERGNDKDSTSEAILRNYIDKHGRKTIKRRWQKFWDDNNQNIYWDETDRCFKLGK